MQRQWIAPNVTKHPKYRMRLIVIDNAWRRQDSGPKLDWNFVRLGYRIVILRPTEISRNRLRVPRWSNNTTDFGEAGGIRFSFVSYRNKRKRGSRNVWNCSLFCRHLVGGSPFREISDSGASQPNKVFNSFSRLNVRCRIPTWCKMQNLVPVLQIMTHIFP